MKLQFTKLICNDPNEWLGDEPYLVVAGKGEIWRGSDVDKGETVDLTSLKPIEFTNKIDVWLWEADKPPGDPNDNLGWDDALASDVNLPHETTFMKFTQGGADYTLYYDVLL